MDAAFSHLHYFIFCNYIEERCVLINTVYKYTPDEDRTKMKHKAMSVYIDDETALALNRLRETIRQRLENEGIQSDAPTLGWLARSLLREKLGIINARNDAPGAL